ncbi:MAG: translation initiation factor IF-2 [Oscillospiraceae bacterium]|nr:translation initiation factor IF-2 [Oscillospiraceae bacterium]
MAETIKLGEISKNLKITNKDIIAKLAEYGVEVKSASSVVNEATLGLILDIYTQANTVSEEEILEMRRTAAENLEKAEKAEKAEAAADKPAPKEEKNRESDKPKTEKPAEVKSDTEKAADVKPKQDIKPKTEKPAESKPKHEKHKKVAKKQSGQKIDLSNVDRTNTDEEFIVKTEERKRYVDTRQSTVELDAIESRERIEDMVPDSIKMDKKGGKVKNKKGGKNRREKEKEKNRQSKKEIKAKVITEIEIHETITVGEFASKMGKTSAEVVKKLMMLGVMATQNQSIDFETAQLIGDDFGIKVKQEVVLTKEDMLMLETDRDDKAEDLVPRPPVVVVMGHVDHGKTSLLDAIRHTSVIDTEAGGITQHIGAYSVTLNDRVITFLDTPGHEAFTTMRARGAQVTDVAILVVAADDGVMPQTIEAINHAKAAGVTIVVAINKIDKEGANPDRVKQMLVEYDLAPEEWGGDTVCVEISAKKHINIDGLLEMVLLVADMQELKANPNRDASGTVIEAQIDKGRGPVATVLVQNGTLKVGDFVIAGTSVGRIRAMINDKGRRVKTAAPSTPVEILGLSEAPSGGDTFMVVENEKLARDVAEQRKQEQQETKFNQVVKVSLDNLFSQIDEGNMKELDVIIKADVQGSVEAVKQSLEKLSNDEVRVKAIHGGVGAINESDVMLANASNAIIVGFNVRPDAGAVASAEQHEVDIRLYRVIYQAIEEIEAAMKGMLDPEYKEVVLGYAEVRQTFKVSNVGTIAGCYVTQGKIQRNAEIRIVRNGIIIHEGKIDSLKRFKDDAKEVTENFECGIGIEGFNDIKEGDTLECFVMEEIER